MATQEQLPRTTSISGKARLADEHFGLTQKTFRVNQRFLYIFLYLILIFCHADSIASTTQTAASDVTDNWLGESTTSEIRVSYGQYQDGGENLSFNGQFPFIHFSELSFLYSEYQESNSAFDVQSELMYVGWQSDPLQTFGYGVNLEHYTQENAIEFYSTRLFLNYTLKEQWTSGVEFIAGEIDVDIGDVFAGEQIGTNLSTQRLGLGVSLNYTLHAWAIGFAMTFYEYDLNLSTTEIEAANEVALGESNRGSRLVFLEIYRRTLNNFINNGLSREEATRATNILFQENREQILATAAIWSNQNTSLDRATTRPLRLGQTSLNSLFNYEATINTQYRTGAITLYLGLSTYEFYLDKQIDTQFFSGIEWDIDQNYLIGLTTSYTTDSSNLFAELTFGVRW